MSSKEKFWGIYMDLYQDGKMTSPRGLLIKEIENYSYLLGPYERFINFNSRNLSVKYIKREFLWYLRGDRHDTSIADHAKIWKDTIEDGVINSNYGQYIFGEMDQFHRVVDILAGDKDSRRASIMILSAEHILHANNDVPCTYALNFRIRNGRIRNGYQDDYLNMSVAMRSQDAIYGMGNDAPAFSFIHEMMLNSLRRYYPNLKYGLYHHTADSFHVYERHFEMLEKIVKGDEYEEVECPQISGWEEVEFLIAGKFDKIPKEYKFAKWLNDID